MFKEYERKRSLSMCDFRLLGFLAPEDGADKLSRNVGKELLLLAA